MLPSRARVCIQYLLYVCPPSEKSPKCWHPWGRWTTSPQTTVGLFCGFPRGIFSPACFLTGCLTAPSMMCIFAGSRRAGSQYCVAPYLLRLPSLAGFFRRSSGS